MQMKQLHRRILMTFLFVGIVILLGLLSRRFVTLSWLVEHDMRIRSWITEHPVLSWCVGLCLYFLLSLIPGTSGKSVVCGWFFGFWGAVVMVDIALTSAALITFLLSRHLLHEVIETRYSVYLNELRRRLEGQIAWYLLMLRLLHTPFTFVNYSAGATATVPTRTFVWTTLVGMLPGTIVFVIVGTQLPTLEELASNGPLQLLDWRLATTLVMTALVPIVIKLWITMYRNKHQSELS